MEVQITDFENAAFAVFVVLLSRAILSFNLNFYIPISKVTQFFFGSVYPAETTCCRSMKTWEERSKETHPFLAGFISEKTFSLQTKAGLLPAFLLARGQVAPHLQMVYLGQKKRSYEIAIRLYRFPRMESITAALMMNMKK
jgi:hypothetical protein